jgi:hypothetical protein
MSRSGVRLNWISIEQQYMVVVVGLMWPTTCEGNQSLSLFAGRSSIQAHIKKGSRTPAKGQFAL